MSKSQGRARSADAERAASQQAALDAAVTRLHQETQLWQTFLSVHRRLVELLADQMMADHQLPLDWFDVLIHLADVPGMRLRQRELRDRLLLSESGVSRLLARMADAGLVERTPADDDRRGVAVALTDKGMATLVAATSSHLDLVAQLFTDKLAAAEAVALEHVLTKLSPGTAATE
ncbi:helix-turn-helix domain-containing protein [Amycolatopsis sp. NPDC024027]|uniref:MarR family winged helix-turn-helix transcriptional regulator n=1 Tax=Amycolatopsis sp. NPDC024027 TaxID=3154327 RepID=UPI0033ED3AA9